MSDTDDHDALALGEDVHTLLRTLFHRLAARRASGHLTGNRLEEIDLRLALELQESEDTRRRFSSRLVARMEQILDDEVQRSAAFRPGHAFCHRCTGAICEHSAPPSPRHVFAGYSLNGMPRWEEFAQVCLDRKHPEVDRLYSQPPAFMTFVQDSAELHGDMLEVLRRSPYSLLGQVTAGYYPLRTRAEEGRGVLAVTIQAGESRVRHRRRRYGLNVVGLAPGGESLDMLWEREFELPWLRAVRWGQSALESLANKPGEKRKGHPGRRQLEGRALGILQGLARRLEQDRRSHSRRTRHASKRHASGERPTRKAVDDARTARSEQCMMDDRQGTVVVLGDRGRTHFFTPAGRLVSSVRYSRDAVARKIKQELWRPVTEAEMKALRDGIGPA